MGVVGAAMGVGMVLGPGIGGMMAGTSLQAPFFLSGALSILAMGLNNAFMSLGRVIGPLWAGAVLDININFPFMTGALVMLIGFVASIFYLNGRTEVAEKPVVAD